MNENLCIQFTGHRHERYGVCDDVPILLLQWYKSLQRKNVKTVQYSIVKWREAKHSQAQHSAVQWRGV